ncbi:unnamed protein product [Vicia faba]|uniref:Translocon-associated protein subunit alpha n=1 Tax=Vicia faba TaxID=3906 RepID=A0AAV1AZ77_VICFA|nr:unnamed protein product [Vicia faba]
MALINNFCFLSFLLFLIASPLLQVVRCQSDEAAENAGEVSDIGIVGDESDEAQDFADPGFPFAPGIETICVFPKNIARLVKGGEEAELLVGLKNDGQSSLNVVAIKASVHLPFDHQLLVQNLTVQVFNNGSVPSSAQATFPYIFSVSKFLQPGPFDLVGTIIYEIDQHPYQNTFYNGTIEVVEPGVLFSMESVFLFTLGTALLVLLGLWINGQIQNYKKPKRSSKVEVGTKTTKAIDFVSLLGSLPSQGYQIQNFVPANDTFSLFSINMVNSVSVAENVNWSTHVPNNTTASDTAPVLTRC